MPRCINWLFPVLSLFFVTVNAATTFPRALDVAATFRGYAVYKRLKFHRLLMILALNAIKATMKLALIGGSSSSSVTLNQYLELCRSVHKLFFQLLLITDKFDEMIKGITNVPDAQDTDMSSEVLCLHRCLLASIPDSVHAVENTVPGLSLESNTDGLLMFLQKKQYKNALHTLRQLSKD
ncbi:unnamed protein product [Gongylonema pulchrum]|uniref:Fry_C domain-containing protein n=1 Tax=Gongylonema pulchrum TaxID=637853 RepID=A0A183CXN7_9BILA|nr:unnamed protein product [Gongylonema pulchrum]